MYWIVIYILGLAVLLSLIRLAIGPTAPDRVVAFDSVSSIVISLIVILSLQYGNHVYIDIAVVYALIGFLGTLAISKYLVGEHIGD